MPSSLSTALATWATQVRVEDLPEDIRTLTRQRILDVMGVALPSIDTAFGRSVHDAVRRSCVAKDTGGPCGPCQDGRVACGCRLQTEDLNIATRACPHVVMRTFGYVVVYAYSHVLTRFVEAP